MHLEASTTTTTTAGREFVRKLTNVLCELQLQMGMHKRVEHLLQVFAEEHSNLRANYLARELDNSYFEAGDLPSEAANKSVAHALAIEGDRLYEFLVFSNGYRRDIVELCDIAQIQETWLEPKADGPFVLRVVVSYRNNAETILVASDGDAQDALQDFLARLIRLRGW